MNQQGLVPQAAQIPILTPIMMLANKLLAMPVMALQEHVLSQQTENPMIEEYEERTEWADGSSDFRVKVSNWDNDDFDPVANLTREDESLQSHLLEQLQYQRLTHRQMAIASYLIGGIDDSGIFEDVPDRAAEACQTTVGEVDVVLNQIQTLDPAGVGGRDPRECLMIQSGRAGESDGLSMELIRDHQGDTRMLRADRLSRKLRRGKVDIQTALRRIGRLNPYPGYAFGSAPAIHIVPDVIIERINGRFEARLTRQNQPRLKISDTYASLANVSAGGSKSDRVWMRQKLDEARLLIKGLEMRGNTLLRVAECIVSRQSGFLDMGTGFLRPMKMSEVAGAIHVATATVSRAQSGKYIQTPQGILTLKSFFTLELQTVDGPAVSNRTVKDRLAELIRAEDSDQPLSDDKLTSLLQGEGVSIKRRTVAKYRKELQILTAHERKRISGLME